MTPTVWVLTLDDTDRGHSPETTTVVAVTATLDRAMQAADDDLDPGRDPLTWVQNHDGSWTTHWADGSCYRASEFEIQH